jgi:tRNA 2-thiouridine synthesizing protein A
MAMQTEEVLAEDVLDLRGLKCPLPALMTRRALARRVEGAALAVIADDPLAMLDIPHMCAGEGHDVVSAERQGDVARFVLRRGPVRPEAAGASA